MQHAFLFPSYIDALGFISEELEGNAFGLREVEASIAGHGLQYEVLATPGSSWMIHQPRGVDYWVVTVHTR